ncbi:MAG TPA: hypothetical protein VGR18_05325 [Rubrobacter sp.]|nr:hypothetical protein [Rubrobacter sp.]
MNTTARDRSRKPTTHGPPPRVGLSEAHRRHLAESSIDPAVSEERGTFTARRGRDVPQDGGKLPKRSGLVFPVHPLDGGILHRLRPDNLGRLPKYLQPKGRTNRLDVHPRQHAAIKRTGGTRYVTEGEKKVDAGVSRSEYRPLTQE